MQTWCCARWPNFHAIFCSLKLEHYPAFNMYAIVTALFNWSCKWAKTADRVSAPVIYRQHQTAPLIIGDCSSSSTSSSSSRGGYLKQSHAAAHRRRYPDGICWRAPYIWACLSYNTLHVPTYKKLRLAMGGADKAYPLYSPSVFERTYHRVFCWFLYAFLHTGCPQVGHRRDRPSEVRVPPGGRRGVSETVSLVGDKLLQFSIVADTIC
jgi:hypothetical protein